MNSFVILYDYVFVTQKKGLFGRRAGRSKAVLTKPEDMEGVCVCVCVCVCAWGCMNVECVNKL